MSRIVRTHSTYIKGLLVVLKRISKHSGIKTIIPGIIKRIDGHKEKLEITISRKTISGYKANARKGNSLQEVYITTKYNRNELEVIIKQAVK